MSFKELSNELDFFDKLPLVGKVFIKICVDAGWFIGAILELVGMLINYLAGKNGY